MPRKPQNEGEAMKSRPFRATDRQWEDLKLVTPAAVRAWVTKKAAPSDLQKRSKGAVRSSGDNRIANLREASQSENQQNIKGARRGSATRLGVSFAKGKWRAEIQVNGRRTNLGHYPTEDSAHAAYLSAKRVMHPFGRL